MKKLTLTILIMTLLMPWNPEFWKTIWNQPAPTAPFHESRHQDPSQSIGIDGSRGTRGPNLDGSYGDTDVDHGGGDDGTNDRDAQ